MTLSLASPRRAMPDLARMWADAPAFAAMALFLAICLVPLAAAMALDARLFQGESPWLKPVKFHLALSIYLITLAFFTRYMSAATRARWPWRAFAATVAFAILAEVAWLSSAAMLNTASHFNTEIPVFTAIYPLMGVFAVLLTSASLVMGVIIWRNGQTGLDPAIQLSIALGLILTFAATVAVAGAMASGPGHFVGTSTRQMAILGWSRDAGDLRVAHFLATHALHGIPLVSLIAARTLPALARPLVIAATLAYAALIAVTFAQARAGLPFLPWLG